MLFILSTGIWKISTPIDRPSTTIVAMSCASPPHMMGTSEQNLLSNIEKGLCLRLAYMPWRYLWMNTTVFKLVA